MLAWMHLLPLRTTITVVVVIPPLVLKYNRYCMFVLWGEGEGVGDSAVCTRETTFFHVGVMWLIFVALFGGGQVLIYGILDIISKAVFGLILMSGASTGYEAI
jgi:hypothetical protein